MGFKSRWLFLQGERERNGGKEIEQYRAEFIKTVGPSPWEGSVVINLSEWEWICSSGPWSPMTISLEIVAFATRAYPAKYVHKNLPLLQKSSSSRVINFMDIFPCIIPEMAFAIWLVFEDITQQKNTHRFGMFAYTLATTAFDSQSRYGKGFAFCPLQFVTVFEAICLFLSFEGGYGHGDSLWTGIWDFLLGNSQMCLNKMLMSGLFLMIRAAFNMQPSRKAVRKLRKVVYNLGQGNALELANMAAQLVAEGDHKSLSVSRALQDTLRGLEA